MNFITIENKVMFIYDKTCPDTLKRDTTEHYDDNIYFIIKLCKVKRPCDVWVKVYWGILSV